MRARHLFLPAAAVVITGLCVYKSTRTYEDTDFSTAAVSTMPAPLFVERDDSFWPVKLSAYLSRHEVIVAFFDGVRGADESELLIALREDYDALRRRGYEVIAIGDATPIENRQTVRRAGGFPFPVLGDVDDEMRVDANTIRRWGRWDEAAGRVRPGLVLVSRAGLVRAVRGVPVAEENPRAALDSILDRNS